MTVERRVQLHSRIFVVCHVLFSDNNFSSVIITVQFDRLGVMAEQVGSPLGKIIAKFINALFIARPDVILLIADFIIIVVPTNHLVTG